MLRLFCVFGLFLCSSFQASNALETPEQRLKQLGISLLPPGSPVANYQHAVRAGQLLYLSGKGPKDTVLKGKLGEEIDLQQGHLAARQTAIQLLSVLKKELGELSKIEKIVKVNGYVNSSPHFIQQPQVLNGASDLFVQVFGEKVGKHARTAIGVSSLPFNIPIEIDMIVLISK